MLQKIIIIIDTFDSLTLATAYYKQALILGITNASKSFTRWIIVAAWFITFIRITRGR